MRILAPTTASCGPRRLSAILRLVLGLGVFCAGLGVPALSAATSDAPSALVSLRIDPRMIIEATEVWGLIASDSNPVWPGWNASDTPLLFYLPGEQDVLINHPSPPEGFVPYAGPVRFPGGAIMVRNGPTLLEWDGQNTSLEIEGVSTLVVADPLSNLRLQVLGLLGAPTSAQDQPPEIAYSQLTSDPYDQMAMMVHEAFHVFQDRVAPEKLADEMLLLRYPVLSADNNVGFAQEGAALAAALEAVDDGAFREAVVRWLALRTDRRSKLSAEAVDYEDRTEFSEGLAKYTEYRLYEVLESRTPAPQMWWVQGFGGYDDLSACRSRLITEMTLHMRGEASVNNDPYGTAPLRMRLYYSGMAIAAILDRISADWKQQILLPEVSLTTLAAEKVDASAAELSRAAAESRQGGDYQALVAAKTQLARDGQAQIDTDLAAIESGDGTGICIDYSALESPDVRLAFTPFGIRVVDDARTIYAQVPIQVLFADGSQIAQSEPMPLLQDKKERLIRFRLTAAVPAGEAERSAGVASFAGQELTEFAIELPGVALNVARAAVRWEGDDLRIDLLAGDSAKEGD
jgi:hypothetical protein